MKLDDPALDALLTRLHKRSEEQLDEIFTYFSKQMEEGRLWQVDDPDRKVFMSDKLVALDREKALFCYQLCRATNARHVVEIGTSYGVSTLYLAAAIHDNGPGAPRAVVGTEYEPNKAARAAEHLRLAGLDAYVDLRVGDLRKTLVDLDGPIDVVLIDIWTEMARPAIEIVSPKLREGSIVLCDNTESYREQYGEYFAFINDPANRFLTMTLPFRGGFELTVRV